jgi:hypothetical protein
VDSAYSENQNKTAVMTSAKTETILKGAGKLGERVAETDWSNLIHSSVN